MKIGVVSLVPVLLCGAIVVSQTVPSAFAQNPNRPQGPASPVVLPDGRVTFSLHAPSATSVTLDGDFPLVGDFHGGRKLTSLTKDDQGVWSVTVGPLKPDIYNYDFNVDGLRTLDPQNAHTSRTSRVSNWVMVPGAGSENFAINDVPHGRVSEVWYPSPTLHMTRRMIVYTPPGYDSGTNRYPVFYLYHGGGEDESAWPVLGRAPEILDNLLAQGKVVPMIVVMPNWNATQALARADDTNPQVVNNAPPAAGLPGGADFQQSVIHDLIPFIDKNYRTIADKDHRAVAGTSAGGTQAILSGLQHTDTFSWIALMSPALARVPNSEIKIALPPDADTRRGPDLGVSIDPIKFAANFPDLGPNTNKQVHLLYFSVGGSEGLLEEEKAGAQVFDQKGVKYQWVTLPGYGHEWAFWRQNFEQFSEEIFKPTM